MSRIAAELEVADPLIFDGVRDRGALRGQLDLCRRDPPQREFRDVAALAHLAGETVGPDQARLELRSAVRRHAKRSVDVERQVAIGYPDIRQWRALDARVPG